MKITKVFKSSIYPYMFMHVYPLLSTHNISCACFGTKLHVLFFLVKFSNQLRYTRTHQPTQADMTLGSASVAYSVADAGKCVRP